VDNYSSQSCEHRQGWVEDKLLLLSSIVGIDSATTEPVLML
jgi:hypothetical protein